MSVHPMQVALVRSPARPARPALPARRGRDRRGGTRWWRFGLVLGGALAAAVLMGIVLAHGAVAASFTVAGVPSKIAADQLRSTGVVQYTSSERTKEGAVPVLVAALRKTEGDNFCQSSVVDVPLVGDVTTRFAAPGRSSVTAENIVLTTERLTADLTITGAEIGRDASTLDAGPPDAMGSVGGFGLQGRSLTLTNTRQISRSVTAATLNLNQAKLSAERGRHECF